MVLTAGVVAALLSCACGAEDDAARAEEGDATASSATATDGPGAAATPTTAAVDGSGAYVALTDTSCAELAGPVVSGALGVEMTEAVATDAGDGCSFSGGTWTVSFTSTAFDPAMTETTPVLSTIPGIAVPHTGRVDLERGGVWNGDVSFVSGDRMVQLRVRNATRGSDTYPPTDGPPQRPVTEQSTVDLANALSGG